jgi:hypothetical protein
VQEKLVGEAWKRGKLERGCLIGVAQFGAGASVALAALVERDGAGEGLVWPLISLLSENFVSYFSPRRSQKRYGCVTAFCAFDLE